MFWLFHKRASFFIKQRRKKAINAMLSKLSYTNWDGAMLMTPIHELFQSPMQKVFSFTSQLALFSKILIHVPDKYRIGSQKSLFFFSTFVSPNWVEISFFDNMILELGSPRSHLFYEIIFPFTIETQLDILEISHPRIAEGCQYLTIEIPSKIFEEENLINQLLELFFATIRGQNSRNGI